VSPEVALFLFDRDDAELKNASEIRYF